MDLVPNLPVLLQACCLGLEPSPPFMVTPALTVATLENPGMHGAQHLYGLGGSQATPTVEMASYSWGELASLKL